MMILYIYRFSLFTYTAASHVDHCLTAREQKQSCWVSFGVPSTRYVCVDDDQGWPHGTH